jgi:iron complex outermembrane receptor protein
MRVSLWLAAASVSVMASAARPRRRSIPGETAQSSPESPAPRPTTRSPLEGWWSRPPPFGVQADALTVNVEVITRDQLDVAPPRARRPAQQHAGPALDGVRARRQPARGAGLSGPRVQVLTNGVGLIDASSLSPDHQVATDPAEAQQIEVVRGPSTLQYGGSAIGGVVNIIDERVPTRRPTDGLDGRSRPRPPASTKGRQLSGMLRTGSGPIVVTVDGLTRRTEDYDIPGPQVSEELADLLARSATNWARSEPCPTAPWSWTRSAPGSAMSATAASWASP